jgi:hypothetical protein
MRFAFFATVATTVVAAASLLGGCDSDSSNPDAALIVVDGAPKNACLAYGQGYVCQASKVCSAGYVNKEDLDCAATGNACCGPIGDGGLSDANDDVNVFVDSAVFETGPSDAAAPPVDTGTPVDAGHDGTVDAASDAGVDSGHDAAATDASKDAASHDANDGAADGSSDAKTG